ncbi:hypothetical protein B0H14DRAFT_2634618 [Mycena olivaceomarginata]|nr:hypothetical protein B0H14DRAFT_2634618 [Mycena olivaceomarginata]
MSRSSRPRFDWGIAGISIPIPYSRDGQPPGPIPQEWDRLFLSLLGAYDLRHKLGVLRQSWEFSCATGASTDNKHKLDRNDTFFPELVALRDSLPLAKNGGGEMRREFEKKFKRVTIWDRAFGGTTLLLHADGATPPGMPVQPEYLKAYGYLPPQFVGDEADTHAALAHIAQLFIEHISTRTVDRFMEAGRNHGWVFTQTGRRHTPFHPTRLIPIPTGTDRLQHLFCQALPLHVAAPPYDDDEFGEFFADDVDEAPMEFTDMQGRVYELELQLAEEHSAREQLEAQLETQAEQMAALYRQIEARATPVPTPTPSRVQAPSTPSRTSHGALSVRTRTTTSITSPSPSRHSSTLMPEDIGKETAAFLRDYRLESLQSQIATIVRLLPAVRYHEEVSWYTDAARPAAETSPRNGERREQSRIMPTSYTTIAAASHRHVRNTAPNPSVPLSTEEQTRKREEREERRDQQDQAVLEWGGAHMINHQDEVNPYNAWKTVKAAESREAGEELTPEQFHERYIDEYRSLTEEEKKVLKDGHTNCPRSCSQDLSNIVRNMQMLLVGLNSRVGAEGFFCIIFCVPQSRRQITSSDEIRDETRSPDVTHVEMQYVNYEEDIVLAHGVKMVGWTMPQFKNPSELSTALAPLQELLACVEGRHLHVRQADGSGAHRPREEVRGRCCRWPPACASSANSRSDFGKKRKAAEGSIGEEEPMGTGTGGNNENDNGEDSDDNDIAPPPAKRSKRAPLTEVQPPPRTAPAKKGGATKKKPAAAAKKTPAAKKAAAPLRRDDDVTRGVIAKMRAEQAARVKSRPIIMSDDETDPEPYTDAGLGSAAAAVPANGTTVSTNAATIPANTVVAPTAT